MALGKVEQTKLSKMVATHGRNARKIEALKKEIKSLRSLLQEVIAEGRKELAAELREDPELRTATQRLQPQELLEKIAQLNSKKSREVDHLKYEKERCLENIKKMQMELSLSQKEVHKDTLRSLAMYLEQSLVLNIHNAVTKKKVAGTINNIYKTILDVLTKDTTYMSRILDDLSQKHRSMCRDVLEAVEINQYLRENVVGLWARREGLEEQTAATSQLQDQALEDMKARVLLIGEQGQQCIVTRHPDESLVEHRRELLPSPKFILLLGQLNNLEIVLEELKTETRLVKYKDVFLRIEDPFHSKCDVDHQPARSKHDLEAWLYTTVDKLMEEISTEEVAVEEMPTETSAAAVAEQRKVIAQLLSRLTQLYGVMQEAQPYTELVLYEADQMVQTLMSDLESFD